MQVAKPYTNTSSQNQVSKKTKGETLMEEEEEETREYLFSGPHRRTAHVTTNATVADKSSSFREGREYSELGYDPLSILAKPVGYLVDVVAAQVDFLSKLVSESKPLNITDPSRLLRKVGRGLFGAGCAITVLFAALVVAFLVGVGMVRMWVEEPVFLRRPLHFDYTQSEPAAEVRFGGGKGRAVPAGHTATVCLELVMPESDYNRHIGMFQVTADVISANGDIKASASQPCMLRFRSLPVQLMRTFIMGVPLLAGLSTKSQKIQMEILRYKESYQSATEELRVRLQARAGTTYLPQIYSSEVIMKSKLPRRKELVYNWKWTFYVWVSLYVYITILIILACCYKPLGLPRLQRGYELAEVDRVEKRQYSSEALRRRRERSRGKRKASLLQTTQVSEVIEGSASSAVGGGEKSEVIDDYGDFAASESSECLGT